MRASTRPRQRNAQVDIDFLLQKENSASMAFELNLSNHTIGVPAFSKLNEQSGDIFSRHKNSTILAPIIDYLSPA